MSRSYFHNTSINRTLDGPHTTVTVLRHRLCCRRAHTSVTLVAPKRAAAFCTRHALADRVLTRSWCLYQALESVGGLDLRKDVFPDVKSTDLCNYTPLKHSRTTAERPNALQTAIVCSVGPKCDEQRPPRCPHAEVLHYSYRLWALYLPKRPCSPPGLPTIQHPLQQPTPIATRTATASAPGGYRSGGDLGKRAMATGAAAAAATAATTQPGAMRMTGG